MIVGNRAFDSFRTKVLSNHHVKPVLRVVLFIYLALVICPIQYFSFAGGSENTWFFALNYAAAHNLVMGRDIVWTSGPLSYLAVPQDIGNNLEQGIAFQTAVWALILGILSDLFFRSSIPLKNLVFFSIFFGLSGTLYHSYSNPLGVGELLLVGAMILFVQFRFRGGMARYITALVMIGLVPLIQIVGTISVLGVVAGLAVDRIVDYRPRVWREVVLTLAVPLLVAGAGIWLTLRSFHTISNYIKGSLELSSGYSLSMSLGGNTAELLAALETLTLLTIAVALLVSRDRRARLFFSLLLAVPLLVSVKHGFVRQDWHIAHFFCFVAVAFGLIALVISLERQQARMTMMIVMLIFATIWQDNVGRTGFGAALGPTGIRTVSLVLPVLRFGHLRQKLRAEAQQNFPEDERLEPEILAIVRHESVAFLSISYSNVSIYGFNLVLYPVFQRYSAYTPYLDELNAHWIRDKGPRFLIFDAKSIDHRHPWTETPAMWVEVYRWYNTRMLGKHNLLLERRAEPRFSRFESLGEWQVRFGDELRFPASTQAIFWTMRCSLSRAGRLRQLLFRVLEVTMTREETGEASNDFRVLPAVLGSPSIGNYLPSDLAEFAAVLGNREIQSFAVEKLKFGGPGASAYALGCAVELLRPVR